MKKIEQLIAFGMLIFAVWFNLRLYRLEPTAKIDPNDNTFQFGLVDRANTIWNFANRQCKRTFFLVRPICHLSYMVDHWVPNWAQGYNLPFYYSHVPQIIIVGSYRFVYSFIRLFGHSFISLFQYYHWIIYFLLCLFPVPVFWALRVIGLPPLIAGAGALLSTHISTDGLYGMDPPSFLWRGWGLSSQLFAMIWMPFAIAYSWKFLTESDFKRQASSVKRHEQGVKNSIIQTSYFLLHNSTFWYAVFFIIATTMGHMGFGIMTFLAIGILAIAQPIYLALKQEKLSDVWESLTPAVIKLVLLAGISIFFLAYWIIPTLLYNNYHNISVWDPIWKFDSYGWKETLVRFFNGELFDWGRFPIFTLLTLIGLFFAAQFKAIYDSRCKIYEKEKSKSISDSSIVNHKSYFGFSLLFAFWLLAYFGRTTWKGLIDLIPSMSEFHISRFIVGLHVSGIFLAPIGIWALSNWCLWIVKRLFIGDREKAVSGAFIRLLEYSIICVLLLLLLPPIYQQTVRYNELNDRLILQANTNYDKQQPDIDVLFAKLRTLPSARVYVGRGGSWGKNFRVAETEMFMHISTYGINTALWLPETWSPNSDTEQYFSEDQAKDYDLYNLKWVATPPDVTPQPFYKFIESNPSWNLYEVPTSGYFTVATRSMRVVSDKQSLSNIVRLWIQSPMHAQHLFPEISFTKPGPIELYKLPTIRMIDEVTYLTNQENKQNIWAINPLYAGDPPKATLLGPETVDTDQIFKTTVKVEQDCKECFLVLKQTYHPNWQATVNGKRVKPINVFPFFVAVPLEHPGVAEVVVWYQPMPVKIFMLCIALITAITFITVACSPAGKKLIYSLQTLKSKKSSQ